MKSVVAKSGLKVRSTIKAGGLANNHSRATLRVKSGVKAGYQLHGNHNRAALK